MNDFTYDSNSINNVIQQYWKWPQLTISVLYEGQDLLKVVFLKIRNIWVSLPHQSLGGLRWNEELINKLLESNFLKGKLSQEEFYKAVFRVLNVTLEKIKDAGKEEAQLVVQLDCKKLHSFINVDLENKTRLFIRSDRTLSPYVEARKVVSELKLKHRLKDQIASFSSSVQRKIRKAKRNGIKIEMGSLKDLDIFYQLYRKRIHQLGSMGLPKRYFQNLLQGKNENCLKLVLARYKGECIGVAILNIYSGNAENLYFATSRNYNHLYPSYALHSKMIKLSIEAQCEYYSFGRSTINSGVHCYKQQWGGQDKILYYNYSWEKRNFHWFQKLASLLIPLLPISIVCLFDQAVSKRCY